MDTILTKVAAYLARQTDSDQDQEEIILYALQLLYSGIGGVIAIIIVASFVGVLFYSLAASLTNAILRVRAGGAHASFPASCFTIGAVVFTLLGLGASHTSTIFLDKYLVLLLVPAYLLSRRILLKYAPAETPEKPLWEEQKKTLRIKTFRAHNLMFFILLTLSIYIFLGLPFSSYIPSNYLFSAMLGILWETYTVSPKGYKLIGVLDRIISKLFEILRLRKATSQHYI